jgi:putative FmdB family regulatory protein
MPIYEFECRKCKDHLEVFQKMSDKPPVKCKKCGGRLEKLVSASAIQFKGSGWYVTDYAGNGRKAAEKAESDSASSDSAASKDTPSASDDKKSEKSEKSEKSDKKTKESSPAKKTSEKASTTKVPRGD